jgi:RNA polymerase sigma-70 factor (ECF subfamily)
LDSEQQALLAMHDIEGHSLAELMELTGLKEGTLKSRLHRARVRLGKLLHRDAPTGGHAAERSSE